MTTGSGAYSQSADALAQLAQAFKVNSDAISIAGMAMAPADMAIEAYGWGSAGTIQRAAYIAAAQSALAAIDALGGVLGAVGNTVAALAQNYGASEADTAGLFDSIG